MFIPATVTSDLINVNMVGKGYVSKVSNIVADIVIYSGANGELYSARLNPTTKEVSNVTSIPTRNEVKALSNKLTPQFIQNITLSNTGAGDTGISSTDFYITQPVVTNKAEVYCQTFIYGGHWYIKVRDRNNDSVATGSVNIRLLKIPV